MKCLNYFIAGAKVELALEAASMLLTHNPAFPKTGRAIDKFTGFLKENLSSQNDKVQEKVKDFEKNLLPVLK